MNSNIKRERTTGSLIKEEVIHTAGRLTTGVILLCAVAFSVEKYKDQSAKERIILQQKVAVVLQLHHEVQRYGMDVVYAVRETEDYEECRAVLIRRSDELLSDLNRARPLISKEFEDSIRDSVGDVYMRSAVDRLSNNNTELRATELEKFHDGISRTLEDIGEQLDV